MIDERGKGRIKSLRFLFHHFAAGLIGMVDATFARDDSPANETVAAGIRLDARGFVPVDDAFRTSAEGVYAIGDCTGKLMLVNNQIDTATGTVQLKAQFPNAAHKLWPGQYVNVHLMMGTRQRASTVPASVVSRKPPSRRSTAGLARRLGVDGGDIVAGFDERELAEQLPCNCESLLQRPLPR